jgi:Protein of unknown function (DUF3667)
MMNEQSRAITTESAASATRTARARRLFSRRRKTTAPLTHCENCGTPLAGPFCAKCGQHAVDYRRSFGRVFADALDSFLNWDSRFFATALLLLVSPWRLTIDFLAGKRVRYVHPLRVYLLVSIIFFFGVHELARRAKVHTPSANEGLTSEEKAKVEANIAKIPADAQREVRAAMEKAPSEDQSFTELGANKYRPTSPFEKWLTAQMKEKIGEHGVNLKVFFLAVINNLPAMMLCCIPLFAFVLKVLYVRRRVLYIDHLIYALHIHAFAYLATIIIGFGSWELARVAPGVQPLATAVFIIAAVVLLFLSIRRVYRQGWFMTVFKFFFGGVLYFFVLCIALAATFFVTLALPT